MLAISNHQSRKFLLVVYVLPMLKPYQVCEVLRNGNGLCAVVNSYVFHDVLLRLDGSLFDQSPERLVSLASVGFFAVRVKHPYKHPVFVLLFAGKNQNVRLKSWLFLLLLHFQHICGHLR